MLPVTSASRQNIPIGEIFITFFIIFTIISLTDVIQSRIRVFPVSLICWDIATPKNSENIMQGTIALLAIAEKILVVKKASIVSCNDVSCNVPDAATFSPISVICATPVPGWI